MEPLQPCGTWKELLALGFTRGSHMGSESGRGRPPLQPFKVNPLNSPTSKPPPSLATAPPPVWQRAPPRPEGHSHLAPPSGPTRHGAAPWQGLGRHGFFSSAQVGPGEGEGQGRALDLPKAPSPRPPCSPLPSSHPSLTESAWRALAVEHAVLQGLAWCRAPAGVGQAGVWPTLAHVLTPQSGPLPPAQLQSLVVDIQ